MNPPERVTESELDARYQTRARLSSGGDYGCWCLVIHGESGVAPRAVSTAGFDQLSADFGGDIGTVLIDGDLRADGQILISDQLMCLVVTGDLVADQLSIFETEVLVCGNLTVDTLFDHDEYLTVLGARAVRVTATYESEADEAGDD